MNKDLVNNINTDIIFFKRLIDTDFVYHYTSIEALLSIMEGYRENGKKYLPFWAGCVYNSNDPREMELGFDVVKEILPEYEKNCGMSMDLSEVFKNVEHANQCKKLFLQKPIEGMVEMANVPYSISFSCKRDFLPMWSMYGNDKKGVCLKFNLGSLIDEWKVINTDFCLVYYEGEEDNLIKDYLLPHLYKWNVELNQINTSELTIDNKIQDLSILCDCISPYVKTEDWAYESEFRIVSKKQFGPEFDNKYFIRGKSMLKKIKIDEHITLPVPTCTLKEIIVGPLANYNVWNHVLLNELKECGLSNIDVSQSSIKITK